MINYLLTNKTNGHRLIATFTEKVEEAIPYLKAILIQIENNEIRDEDIEINEISLERLDNELRIESELITRIHLSAWTTIALLKKQDILKRLKNDREKENRRIRTIARKNTWFKGR